jgi:selenocysteine lyase/cysteine desulfurase
VLISGSAGASLARSRTSDSHAADDLFLDDWRKRELSRLERTRLTYLDYTGAALYPESLVREDAERLAGAVLGNPHSEHAASRDASADLEDARAAILELVHASPDEYEVTITANATAAARLVAESFAFGPGSLLALTADNHNSVNGIRQHALARGATLRTIELDADLRLRDPQVQLDGRTRAPGLFAFPAQSNFSGVRHPLSLAAHARECGWRVLLDAAAYVPTADLDLGRTPMDFVALSIYKITGYPSGVGALVSRREALAELRRPWFSGGTVDWVSVRHNRHRLTPGGAGFEDGTVPYLARGAVRPALTMVGAVGRERLARHLTCLTSTMLERLTGLRHGNGRPMVRIHGPLSTKDRGATIAFTVLDADGRAVPYWCVEAEAREAGIAVRGGCFCNPVCAESAFAFAERKAMHCLDDLGDRFTIPRLAECLGDGAVGAIRASLGLGSVQADVERLARFLEDHAARHGP